MKFMFSMFIVLFSIIGNANELKYDFKDNSINDKDNINNIVNGKVWRQLLYYKSSKSEVKDTSYFLAVDGNENPTNELIETINNYQYENITDESPVCKFPARYYHLSKYVNFPKYETINKECSRLNKWSGFKDTSSLSVILVSGYISNPASTFGHSFLKLNNEKSNGMFDYSMNYGALVPNDENILKYIFKGLTGGYEAGFSDKYFYTQDLTYSNTEFRDMWEYKLNITEEDKNLILLHLWEIIGKKFDYFFLTKNCGFRVSEIINLISTTTIVGENPMWFLPVETFYDLEQIKNSKNESIISEINFIPSNSRVFDFYFNKLNSKLKEVVKDLIKTKLIKKDNFNSLSEEEKIEVLDFLLLFYKNSIITDPINEDLKELKKEVLVERFKYNISETSEDKLKEIPSPSKNTTPIDFKLGGSYNKIDKGYSTISFSPYYLSYLGISNMGLDELITLNTEIGFNEEKIFLEKFELIKIRKMKLEENDNLLGGFDYSWKLNIGVKKTYNYEKKEKYNTYLTYGIGKTYKISEFYISPMIDTTLNNDNEYIAITPNINIDYSYTQYKLNIDLGVKYNIFDEKNINNEYINLSTQYNISKNNNLGYYVEYDDLNIKHSIKYKMSF